MYCVFWVVHTLREAQFGLTKLKGLKEMSVIMRNRPSLRDEAQLGVRVRNETAEKLLEIAEREEISVSAVIRRAIRQELLRASQPEASV